MDQPETLLDCPFCGHAAEYGESEDGGQFVQCTYGICSASSKLIYPLKEGVTRLLREAWNQRAVAHGLSSNGRSAVALHALVRSVRDTNGTTGMEYNDFIQNVEKLCNFAEALQAELDGADKVIANYAQASNDAR